MFQSFECFSPSNRSSVSVVRVFHTVTVTVIVYSMTPSESFCLKTVEETAAELFSDIDRGLSLSEVDRRRIKYGRYTCNTLALVPIYRHSNFLEPDAPEPMWKKFLEQLKQPLIMLLLVSAIISLLMKQVENAASIACVRM